MYINHSRLFISLILVFACFTNGITSELKFASSESRVSLIEVYTSEGCSSCPPADRWLSKFKQSDLIWHKVVPVAFHVDYWDYLGWKDKFADARFARRQYDYQKMNYVSAVYTPGVMKNGREWRGWRWWQSSQSEASENPGILSAKLNSQHLAVTFHHQQQALSPYVLNVALLGTDIESYVRSGENRGEKFKHDFVVLNFQQYPQKKPQQTSWNIKNSLLNINPEVSAISIWISQQNDLTPIQATGAWLTQP